MDADEDWDEYIQIQNKLFFFHFLFRLNKSIRRVVFEIRCAGRYRSC